MPRSADDPLAQAVARLTKMASDPNNRWRIACRPNCATNEYLNRGACDCGGQELWEAIPRALAALHAAREDAARLDWLEAQARSEDSVMLGWNCADSDYNEFSGEWCSWPASFWCADEEQSGQPFDSLRAAIDAARAANQGEGG